MQANDQVPEEVVAYLVNLGENYSYVSSKKRGKGVTYTLRCSVHGEFTQSGTEIKKHKPCEHCVLFDVKNLDKIDRVIVEDVQLGDVEEKHDNVPIDDEADEMFPGMNQYLRRVKIVALKFGGECLDDAWMGDRAQMHFRCREDHLFTATSNNVISHNSGCPICNSSTSLGEETCREALSKLFSTPDKIYVFQSEWLQMDENRRKMELDCYEADLVLSDGRTVSLALEHNGKGHTDVTSFMNDSGKVIERDAIKDEYCGKNNIILLRVNHLIESENILEFIKNLLSELNIPFNQGDIELDYGAIKINRKKAAKVAKWVAEMNMKLADIGYVINVRKTKILTCLWVKCSNPSHEEYKTTKYDFFDLNKKCGRCNDIGTTPEVLTDELKKGSVTYVNTFVDTINYKRNILMVTYRCDICPNAEPTTITKDNATRALRTTGFVCGVCNLNNRGAKISAAKFARPIARTAGGKTKCKGFRGIECNQLSNVDGLCKTCHKNTKKEAAGIAVVVRKSHRPPCPGINGLDCPTGLMAINKVNLCRTCQKKRDGQ